ncbi:MAG: ferritin [Candidatus Kapaibacterium sp.]
MIKEIIQEAINRQIVREMYSSNLYLAMAAYYASINLNGFANWMHVQAEEETQHALKFYDYLIDRGGQVKIGRIEAPPSQWDSPLHAFQNALEHEQKVTQWIYELADLAIDERDHATSSLLQWFIDEQVEEEATTGEMVDRLKLAGDSKGGLFMLDNELKQRNKVVISK